MKPPRRVTAQRKFAQGAPVPAAAAVGSVCKRERREEPASSTSHRKNVVRSNMSAKGLLNVVSFASSHTHHIEPIVLVERLRDRNLNNNSDRLTAVRETNVRPDAKLLTPNKHAMELRSKCQKSTLMHAYRMCCQNSSIPKSSKPRHVIRNIIKSVPVKRAPPKRAPPKAKKCRPTRSTKISLRGNKRHQTLRSSRLKSNDFSLEDNRPLTYFATKKATRQAVKNATQSTMQTDTPSATTNTTQGVPQSVLANVTQNLPPTTHAVPEVQPLTHHLESSSIEIISSDVKQDAPLPILASLDIESSDTPELLFTVDVKVKSYDESEDNSAQYYSEQGIHAWMDGSLPEETATSPHCQQTEDTSSYYEDDIIRLDFIPPNTCPAAAWKSVNMAAVAAKSLFDSRCDMCRQCERIKKVMTLTTLLKRQRRIECTTDDTQPGTSFQTNSPSVKITMDSAELECLMSELLPLHPHLMIKVQIMRSNTAQYFAWLIPRTEINKDQQLMLEEHEHIFDIIIERLSLDLGDGPSNLVQTEIPTPGTSSIKMSHHNIPDFSKPSEVNMEEEDGERLNPPIFYPTKEEFQDPIKYIERIWDKVVPFGICKIIPPASFAPPCNIDDEIEFTVSNQYISRLYNRWGPAAREMSAIKACLKAEKNPFHRPPLLDGLEVNLPKLYNLVQRYGGLENVLNKKKWSKIAQDMKVNRNPSIENKLDGIYFRYLLPYNALSPDDRQEFLRKVERAWNKRYQILLDRTNNPLQRMKDLLDEAESTSAVEDEVEHLDAIIDVEDCVKVGGVMNIARFKKISRCAYDQLFRNKPVDAQQIEEEYWKRVASANDHVCVYAASIDTGEKSYGFPKTYTVNWNLKAFSKNPGNILSSLGPALGVTVPTLHLGMVFSTSCWHRDPHCLPWIEYFHQGSTKIWYAVPEHQESNFRRVTEILNPMVCQNKSIWLSSDIAMIPPNLLTDNDVKVHKIVQHPGEFVLVMPRAYSCSITTDYTVSESTYFATDRWLYNLMDVFKEIRESCEPTMFALEHLLKNMADYHFASISALKRIQPWLEILIHEEIQNRTLLQKKGVMVVNKSLASGRTKGKRNSANPPEPPGQIDRDRECEVCRCSLYFSQVAEITPRVDSLVCTEHALTLLEKPKYAHVDVSRVKLYCNFTILELQTTLKKLSCRIAEAK